MGYSLAWHCVTRSLAVARRLNLPIEKNMNPLRFLHIPKTAGSTFTDILYREYSAKKIFSFASGFVADRERFQAMSETDKANVALFVGHAPIGTGIREADEATTITFLRDPILRAKSFCQHVSEGKSPHLVRDFPPKRFDLDRFLDSGNGELTNLQTKMLVCRRVGSSSGTIDNMSAAEARDAALDNLYNKIAHFGLQEYFDESLIIFSSAFDWKIPVYHSLNKNNSGNLLRFEKRHLDRLAELNAIDIEVYSCAKERFMNVLGSSDFDEARLRRLRLVNNPVGRLVEKIVRRISS